MTQDRCTLELRLVGLRSPQGEILLGQLADISRHVQELALRVARTLVHAAGPGRTPRPVDESVRLTLTALSAGSTVLEISGPEPSAQAPLFGAGEFTVRVFDSIAEAFADIAAGAVPPLSRPALESTSSLFKAAGREDDDLSVTVRVPQHDARSFAFRPSAAAALLDSALAPAEAVPVANSVVSGELYRVDTHSNQLRVQDDLGNSVDVVAAEPSAQVWRLIGERVIVEGNAETGANGRISRLTEASVRPDASPVGLDREVFWRPVGLDRLLSDAEPFDPTSPAVVELDHDELEAFLADIKS